MANREEGAAMPNCRQEHEQPQHQDAAGQRPRRRVTFSNPEVEKSPEGEETNCSTEPSISDVETWLEWQAWAAGHSRLVGGTRGHARH